MADANAMPQRKVTVGLVAGSAMTILAFIYASMTGKSFPAEVALAGATLITFVLQYVVPNAE